MNRRLVSKASWISSDQLCLGFVSALFRLLLFFGMKNIPFCSLIWRSLTRMHSAASSVSWHWNPCSHQSASSSWQNCSFESGLSKHLCKTQYAQSALCIPVRIVDEDWFFIFFDSCSEIILGLWLLFFFLPASEVTSLCFFVTSPPNITSLSSLSFSVHTFKRIHHQAKTNSGYPQPER